jgi:hypothetical protein
MKGLLTNVLGYEISKGIFYFCLLIYDIKLLTCPSQRAVGGMNTMRKGISETIEELVSVTGLETSIEEKFVKSGSEYIIN